MTAYRSASNPIGRRLILLIVGFSSLIALFTTSFQLFQDYRQRRDDLDRLLERPPLSYSSIAESVWNFDDIQIRLALEALARLPTVEAVTVETEGGRYFWRVGQVVSPHILAREFPLDYATPDKVHRLGTLTIVASLDRIYERVLSHALVALVGNLLKTFLVVIFMYALFRRLVTQRLEALAAKVSGLRYAQSSPLAAEAASDEARPAVREVVPGDEIDLLQGSFDQMWRQLSLAANRQQAAYQQLRQVNAELESGLLAQRRAEEEVIRLNTSLEQRVVRRTAELEQSKQAVETVNEKLRVEIAERLQTEAELLRAKNAADQASLSKSRFLAAASHDLRQPIQAIGLFADALARSPLSDEQERLCRYLSMASSALGELLNTLLDVSRLDAGVVKPRPTWVDAFDLFQRIDRECAGLALAKKLRFKLYFPQRGLAFVTDIEVLMGIVRNIVGNAIKYTPRGGVLIGLRRRDGHLLLQVWDSGIGITDDHLPRLYDEYFQVDNAHRDRAGGMGLGLSIAKRMADLLGYHIRCRSRLGQGTVFDIVIPLASGQLASALPMEAHAAVSPEAGEALSGRHVILIEDDRLVADAVSAWLESHGAMTTTFSRADEALAAPITLAADFYVSDYRLPGLLNGAKLLDAIQKRKGEPIRAVLITGDTAVERIDSFAAGHWRVLHKPVDSQLLLQALTGETQEREDDA